MVLLCAVVHAAQAQGSFLRELKLDSLGQGISISEPGTALLEIISPIEDLLRFDSNVAKKLAVEQHGNHYLVTCPAMRQIITIMADGFMNLNLSVTLEANKSYTAKIGIVEEAAEVTTDMAIIINETSAAIKGVCNPKGLTTNVYFEYGLSKNYDATVAGSPPQITGMKRQGINAVIEDLAPNMTYHFRIVAKNNGGTTYGNDQTFSMIPSKPGKKKPGESAPKQRMPKEPYHGFWGKPNLLVAGTGAILAVSAFLLRSSANASYDEYKAATSVEKASHYRDQTEKKDTYTTVAVSLSSAAFLYSAYKYYKYHGQQKATHTSIDVQHDGRQTRISLSVPLR